MKKLLTAAVMSAALSSGAFAQAPGAIAFDQGSNYGGDNPDWAGGSNEGFGFGDWVFESTQGSGSAGVFIGNPAAAGITGMSTTSFGFFANPASSGANAQVYRPLENALNPGDVFSFQWGLNWDSSLEGSNRGFNLFSGGDLLFNINMGNSATITNNGSDMFTEFGTQAFTLNFEQVSTTSMRVFGTGRDGSETYNNTFTDLAGAADGFVLYYNAADLGPNPEGGPDQSAFRQMYVNDLQVVPEPSTYALLMLGAAAMGGYVIRRRRR